VTTAHLIKGQHAKSLDIREATRLAVSAYESISLVEQGLTVRTARGRRSALSRTDEMILRLLLVVLWMGLLVLVHDSCRQSEEGVDKRRRAVTPLSACKVLQKGILAEETEGQVVPR